MKKGSTFSTAAMAMWAVVTALVGMAIVTALDPANDPFLPGFLGGFAVGCALYVGWFALQQNSQKTNKR